MLKIFNNNKKEPPIAESNFGLFVFAKKKRKFLKSIYSKLTTW